MAEAVFQRAARSAAKMASLPSRMRRRARADFKDSSCTSFSSSERSVSGESSFSCSTLHSPRSEKNTRRFLPDPPASVCFPAAPKAQAFSGREVQRRYWTPRGKSHNLRRHRRPPCFARIPEGRTPLLRGTFAFFPAMLITSKRASSRGRAPSSAAQSAALPLLRRRRGGRAFCRQSGIFSARLAAAAIQFPPHGRPGINAVFQHGSRSGKLVKTAVLRREMIRLASPGEKSDSCEKTGSFFRRAASTTGRAT